MTGVAASALHGAKWVDALAPIDLNCQNNKAPPGGIVCRAETLLDDEVHPIPGLPVTTLPRTAFDLARRGTMTQAVTRVDALANSTRLAFDDVLDLLPRHPNLRGVRRVPAIMDLADAGSQSPPGDVVAATADRRWIPAPPRPRYQCCGPTAVRSTSWTWVARRDGRRRIRRRATSSGPRDLSQRSHAIGVHRRRRVEADSGGRRRQPDDIIERTTRAWTSSQTSGR